MSRAKIDRASADLIDELRKVFTHISDTYPNTAEEFDPEVLGKLPDKVKTLGLSWFMGGLADRGLIHKIILHFAPDTDPSEIDEKLTALGHYAGFDLDALL